MMNLTENRPIRNPADGVWNLYNNQNCIVDTFKTRAEAVDASHQIEIFKIRRIKKLEQYYSLYKGLYMWRVY